VLGVWVDSLKKLFDDGYQAATFPHDPTAFARASLFEDDADPVSARALASNLGLRTSSLRSIGPLALEIHHAARKRLFPSLSGDTWGNVVLAATLRAYVLLIDPHGAWAPLDEETTLYDVELETSGRRHLWGRMTRTAAGARIDERPVAPLMHDDVVLAIDGIAVAGLSVEQVEQLGVLDPNDESPIREVLLLRQGEHTPIRVHVRAPDVSPMPRHDNAFVEVYRVPYRSGHAVVVTVRDVPDNLGVELANALAEVRIDGEPEGLLLDLRGNGGGSIEGAKEALSAFLPGANLFPMRRRSGAVEIEQAPEPAWIDVWPGPVAVIVDSDTASAAEMIAGAIAAYQRGVVIGARTYGKGCAQEYLEDSEGKGVLRLSTLAYALPDGTPVQKVGISPDFWLDRVVSAEREELLPNAMVPWKGPDVRTKSLVRRHAWPLHDGRVGPCEDEVVCMALTRVGDGQPEPARQVSRKREARR